MLYDGQMSTDTVSPEDTRSAQEESQFGGWEPQRRMTLDAARRRSGLIRVLRWGFIILSVLIVGIVIAYLIISARSAPVPDEPVTPAPTETTAMPATTEPAKPDDLVIENVVFDGVDKNGHPYRVTADRAVRRTNPDGSSSEVTDLVNPKVETYPGSADNSIVTADKGVYDSVNKTLDLNNNVKLVTPDGYVYVTQHVHYEANDNHIAGDLPVRGIGAKGSIDADGFEILDGGNRVIFHGRVKTHILNTQ